MSNFVAEINTSLHLHLHSLWETAEDELDRDEPEAQEDEGAQNKGPHCNEQPTCKLECEQHASVGDLQGRRVRERERERELLEGCGCSKRGIGHFSTRLGILTVSGKSEVTQKQRSSYSSLMRQVLLKMPTHSTPKNPLHTHTHTCTHTHTHTHIHATNRLIIRSPAIANKSSH